MAHGGSYEKFIDMFRQEKTTEDCHTPPEVYEAVADYAAERAAAERRLASERELAIVESLGEGGAR